MEYCILSFGRALYGSLLRGSVFARFVEPQGIAQSELETNRYKRTDTTFWFFPRWRVRSYYAMLIQYIVDFSLEFI